MTRALFSYLRAMACYPLHLAIDAIHFFITVVRYYPNAQFRRADLRCLWTHFIRNPYVIWARYVYDFPDDEVQKVYGETFFTTLEKIAKAVNLSERDVLYDLGCGRGRAVFWFNAFYKCRAIGVDIFPPFVLQARRISNKLEMDNVDFIFANLLNLDYDDATIIYLYGTAFEDEAIVNMVDHFRRLRSGTRIVTASYPLTDYTDDPLFEVEQEIKARFPWGSTEIYVQRRL